MATPKKVDPDYDNEILEQIFRVRRETSNIFPITKDYCVGSGVDFGCESDPHPFAQRLVDMNPEVENLYGTTHSVHIRDINAGFPDWEDDSLDFAYTSHCIEHLRNPINFIKECTRIVRPGGNIVIVGPHEDWYWPVGHPDANPDHSKYNWSLSPRKIVKWFKAACNVSIIHISEHGYPENWSWCVVARKEEANADTQDTYILQPEWYSIDN